MKPEPTQAEKDKEDRVRGETTRFWDGIIENWPIYMKDRWVETVTQMKKDPALYAPLLFCFEAGYSIERTLTILLIDHWLIKKGIRI